MSDEVEVIGDKIPEVTIENAAEETSVVEATDKNHFIVAQQLARLNSEEVKQVEALRSQINFSSTTDLMSYGAQLGVKRANFSDSILERYKNKDIGPVGEIVGGLVTELKSYEIKDTDRGIFKFFKQTKNKIESIRVQYENADKSVKKVTGKLEGEIITLSNDINLLDKMYDKNLEVFQEHTIYIIAGKQKLEEVRQTELINLQLKAQETGLPEDAEAYKQLDDKCNNFEKYLYNLELSRTLCLLSLPRLKGIQNANQILVDKIKQTIDIVMPLWKDNIATAIIAQHTKDALDLQNMVDDATNAMLRKVADETKNVTVGAAKASQRGIVDIDTMKYMFTKTVETMEECNKIIVEGKEAMYNNEVELDSMEKEYAKQISKGV